MFAFQCPTVLSCELHCVPHLENAACAGAILCPSKQRALLCIHSFVAQEASNIHIALQPHSVVRWHELRVTDPHCSSLLTSTDF